MVRPFSPLLHAPIYSHRNTLPSRMSHGQWQVYDGLLSWKGSFCRAELIAWMVCPHCLGGGST